MSALKFYMSIVGAKAVRATFKRLGIKTGHQIARRAVSKGLNVITREIRKSVPKPTTKGHSNKRLKSAVGQVVLRKNKRAGVVQSKAGANVGRKKAKQAPHFPLFLLGTKPRRQTKTGRYTGRVPPKHLNVIPSAVKRASGRAAMKIGQELWAGIRRFK